MFIDPPIISKDMAPICDRVCSMTSRLVKSLAGINVT